MVAAKVRAEPVLAIGTVLNVVIVMLCTYVVPHVFKVHLSTAEVGAISTISTAVCGMIAAFLVKPAHLGAINAAVSTILVACAAFGLHMTSGTIAEITAAVSVVLGYLLREKVSPAAFA